MCYISGDMSAKRFCLPYMQSFLASYVLQTSLPEDCAFKYADEAFGVGAPTYLQEPDSRERCVVHGLQLRIPEMADGVFIQSASSPLQGVSYFLFSEVVADSHRY